MTLHIREFDQSDADYDALAVLHNALYPHHTGTAQEMRDGDARRDPAHKNQRWLAADETGTVVGRASYSQSTWSYHPHHFYASVGIHPDCEGHGWGGALYQHLASALAVHHPTEIRCSIREDKTRAVRFAQDRGFAEEMREWESRLDVAAFDPAPWADAREKAAQNGFVIRSVADLADDPDRDRKVWELEAETSEDVPSMQEYHPPTFEQYQRDVFTQPNFLPEAFFIALDKATGEYIGSSNVWHRQADRDLNTGLTAVKRAHRRKGIALALKLQVIEYAQARGVPVIRTENATTNRPMLSINEALGFVKQPATISFVKHVGPVAGAGQEKKEQSR